MSASHSTNSNTTEPIGNTSNTVNNTANTSNNISSDKQENKELKRILTYSISGNAINTQEIIDRLEKSGVPKDKIKMTQQGVSVKIDNPTVEQINVIHDMSPSDPFRISGFPRSHPLLDWDPFSHRSFRGRLCTTQWDPFDDMYRLLDHFDRAFFNEKLPYYDTPRRSQLPIKSKSSCSQNNLTNICSHNNLTNICSHNNLTNEQLEGLLKSLENKESVDPELMKRLVQNELTRRSK